MYSLIIPVYKNEASIEPLLGELTRLNDRLEGELEVVFVVDGSPDRCFERLTHLLPKASFKSRLLILSRNFGSFAAIRVGLRVASGTVFAVMAADLQEPPDLVVAFFESLRADEADVVVGTRTARQDPLLSRTFSKLFWLLYRRFIQAEAPPDGVDVFGCNTLFRDHLLALDEAHSSMVGLLLWLGFRRKAIPYQRLKRKYGKSSWTFWKKVHYLFDSTFSFSNLPIQALFWTGLLGLTTSIILSTVVAWARLTGRIQVPGYSPIVLAISFFGSLNLLSFGIVGSYLWRTFENTKQRPGAIIMKDLSFDPKRK